jgi:regulatory protein
MITAITPTPRHPGRFDVLVDGKCVATLSLDAIEQLQLAVGSTVAGKEERIAREAAQTRVYDRAINMLAFRARSSAELARSLRRKGAAKELVNHAIGRLTEQGLIDDVAFAQSFTRAKVHGAQQSRRRVQQDLARKGVTREVSDKAIATVFEDEQVDQREIVEVAARKKLRTLKNVDPAVRRRRLYAFLARRGYDAEDIRRAMDAVGEELRGGEETEE